jgi:IS30 family transposase
MEKARHINRWTSQEVNALRQLAKENTPTRVIALKLGRSETSIYAKAQREGISLKPTNQSPYG